MVATRPKCWKGQQDYEQQGRTIERTAQRRAIEKYGDGDEQQSDEGACRQTFDGYQISITTAGDKAGRHLLAYVIVACSWDRQLCGKSHFLCAAKGPAGQRSAMHTTGKQGATHTFESMRYSIVTVQLSSLSTLPASSDPLCLYHCSTSKAAAAPVALLPVWFDSYDNLIESPPEDLKLGEPGFGHTAGMIKPRTAA